MAARPLEGLRVLEFSHTVMGPTAGLLFAELGADVIKVEPAPDGDRTRRLGGFGAGFFAGFNRNKRSLAIDLKSKEGQAVMHRLVPTADIVLENFGPGTMERLGCGWEHLAPLNDRLIYLALKGYLAGPYEHRPALDEVVQFQSGLAWMTGPPGRPLRAGASVIDIMGAMFGVIAIQGAVRAREATGRGQEVQASLFENNVFLMAQAMLGETMSGEPAEPWSVKAKPWPLYDLVDLPGGSQLFVGIIGDEQWVDFCTEFGRPGWLDDPRLATNNLRADARPWLLPEMLAILTAIPEAELVERLDRIGLPFAPVRRPGELNEDPHLLATGGLIDITLPNGRPGRAPALPLMMDGERLRPSAGLPKVGEHTRDVLAGFGFDEAEVAALLAAGAVGDRPAPPRHAAAAE